ncbi:MAG: hypothetical protein FJ009_21085 [Chloroflexi bacterium]|nr:hypothetical protein [Chloroflexota bacterium]
MQTIRFGSLARRWTARGALVWLLLLMTASLVSAAHTWTQKTTASAPGDRSNHAMAYIGTGKALLFGGNDWGGGDDETWVYDLSANTWTQMSPVGGTKPSARWRHAMAYIGDDQVLLFGGWNGSGFFDDTWVYDLSDNTWTNQNPVTKPSARRYHAMAYLGNAWVVLFGGYDPNTNIRNDTWIAEGMRLYLPLILR